MYNKLARLHFAQLKALAEGCHSHSLPQPPLRTLPPSPLPLPLLFSAHDPVPTRSWELRNPHTHTEQWLRTESLHTCGLASAICACLCVCWWESVSDNLVLVTLVMISSPADVFWWGALPLGLPSVLSRPFLRCPAPLWAMATFLRGCCAPRKSNGEMLSSTKE